MSKLIIRHTSQGSDTLGKAKAQTRFYGILLQGLSVSIFSRDWVVESCLFSFQRGTHHTAHLKLQQEIAHWAYLEEEAKRKVVSAHQAG